MLRAVCDVIYELRQQAEEAGSSKSLRIGAKTWEKLRKRYQIAHDDHAVNEGAPGSKQ